MACVNAAQYRAIKACTKTEAPVGDKDHSKRRPLNLPPLLVCAHAGMETHGLGHPMNRRARVLLNGSVAGTLEQTSSGYLFSYDRDYLANAPRRC